MTECNQSELEFPVVNGRKVQANFTGGHVTSNGGVLLLKQADQYTGLMEAIAHGFHDPRRQASCDHSLLTMLRQRVFALAPGDEDLNDHDTLRHDIALQTAVNQDSSLVSAPTLCRLENSADRDGAMHEVLIEQFIAAYDRPPKKLILDVDATDDAVHGMQEGRFFHGYYDHYCFLPLYVFCGERLLVSYLRPSNIDGANPRYVVTNLHQTPKWIYTKLYCARGDMENRIKEQQLNLFADRTSCHDWWANQFRLLLSSLAYGLLETIRRVGLAGTELARAQAGTIRLKLSEDRCRDSMEHAPHSIPSINGLPASRAVLSSRCST